MLKPSFDSSKTFVIVSKALIASSSFFSAVSMILFEIIILKIMAVLESKRPIVQIIILRMVPLKSIWKSGQNVEKQEAIQISIVPIEKRISCLFRMEINWLQTIITARKHAVLYGKTVVS